MDVTDENVRLCETEKLPGTAELTETEEVFPESAESAEQLPVPVDEPADTAVSEDLMKPIFRNYGRVFSRFVCTVLASIGVLSYGFLGYNGVRDLQNGGLRELVGKYVYGGVVVSAKPMADEGKIELIPPETEIPSGEKLQILSEDIGCSDPDEVFNETDYKLEGQTVPTSVTPEYSDGKTVLIIHTHGTEGYAAGREVSEDEDFRTDDPEKSVVAAGSAFAEVLESRGIRTIHCKEMFDLESYTDSYYLSGKAVSEYIKNDPEIAYVIDMHRDAVIRENGDVIRSDGAQLMIVCGSDEMGADFPDWRENFAFGKAYQRRLYEKAPDKVRHMQLRSASFNQQLGERYLLLEVGTCGNTLAEATASAKIAAEVFADMILGE